MTYDHRNTGNKSSEELVRELTGKLKDKLDFEGIEKFKVGVWESEELGVEGGWINTQLNL